MSSQNAIIRQCDPFQPGPWFHGSPEQLDILLSGSWVTPFRELAKAFSHKPTRITVSDDDFMIVRHDGKIPGFLYVVSELLDDQDLEELPNTDQTHWRTMRALKVKLVGEVPLVETERLSDAESADLAKRYPGTGYWSTSQGND